MDTETVTKELQRIAAEAGDNVAKVKAEVKALKESNQQWFKITTAWLHGSKSLSRTP